MSDVIDFRRVRLDAALDRLPVCVHVDIDWHRPGPGVEGGTDYAYQLVIRDGDEDEGPPGNMDAWLVLQLRKIADEIENNPRCCEVIDDS